MEGRHLDLTIVSADDLKKVNMIGKMHTYAVAWVDPYLRQQTAIDKDGGTKPSWNHKLSFPVPEFFFQQPNSHLTIEIFSKGFIFDEKFVGSTVIPLSDLAQKANQGEVSTYQVKRRSGKVKGSLQLVTHVGEKTTISASAPPPPSMPAVVDSKDHAGAPTYGYPPTGAAMAAPYGYPPPAQYPQSYGGQGYYPQAGAPPQYYGAAQQPQYYAAAQPPRRQGMGGMGMGLGAGLLAGAVGGLIVGDMVDDAFDGGCNDGGFDF